MYKIFDESSDGHSPENYGKVSTVSVSKTADPSTPSPINIILGRLGQKFPHSLLSSFEEFLEIPEEPIDLPKVLANATKMFDFHEEIKVHYPSSVLDAVLAQGAKLAASILGDPLLDEILKDCNPKSQKLPRLWGYYATNPVYVALHESPESHRLKEKYLSLLAHISIASAELKLRMESDAQDINEEKSSTNSPKFQNAIRCTWLCLRKLADEENQHVLATLPDLKISPKELIHHLDNTGPLLHPIQVLLNYFLEVKNPPQRTTLANGQGSKAPYKPTSPSLVAPAIHKIITSNPDPAQAGKIPTISLTQLPTKSGKDLVEMEASGLAPTECRSRVEMLTCEHPGTHPTAGKSPRQQVIHAKQVKNRLAMANQHLPIAYELPSLYELSSLLKAVGDLFRNGLASRYLPGNIHPYELGAFLSAMFWQSCPLEEAIELRLYHRPPTYANPKRGLLLYRSDSQENPSCLWLTRSATPKRKILPSAFQRSFTLPVKSHFYINSGQNIEVAFTHYIRQLGPHSSGRLFPHSFEYYKSAVDLFLAKANGIHLTRWTAHRLSSYLFHYVANQKGADLTCAMFLFGQEHFLGRNPAYYTAVPVRVLQDIYRTACTEILSFHAEEQGVTFVKKVASAIPFTSHSDHVGSPFCPSKSAVEALAGHLQEALQKAKDLPGLTVDKLLRVHNSLVRYTVFFVAFSTAYRGVREAIILPSELHWESRFAVFSDKNSGDGFKDRPMWIPKACLEQLRLFWAHVALVFERLQALCPDIYYLSGSPRGADKAGILFLRKEKDDSYTWRKVSPGFLIQGLDGVYPLPINSGRHYLRSYLLQRKAPIDIINAYMSHFERGEEPFGRFSALPPQQFRNALEEHLDPLLEADGWVPMSGLEL